MRPEIDDVRALTFASMIRWKVDFTNVPSEIASLFNDGALSLVAETSEVPKATNLPMEIRLKGHKVKQPGITEYQGTLTVTFLETVDNVVSKAIKAWRDIIWEARTGKSKNDVSKNLKGVITLTMLDNEDNPRWEYVLHGCYLEDYEAGGVFDGVTPDAQKPSMILSYDYFIDNEIASA